MSVWTFEAAEISDTENLDSLPIYRTPDINEFLNFGKSQKRLICGLKGTGKTLFLKLISHHHRRLGGFTLIPTTQLTERLYSIDHDFSSDRAATWSSHERWKHVWRTVLAIVVLKALRHEIDEEVLNVFPENLGISIAAHLSRAIQIRGGDSRHFSELFANHLDAPIQRISQPVAVFVDNIDEALARHAGYDLYYHSIHGDKQSGAHSYDIWLAGQLGFILAVRELTARNAHLKLFGTIRSEAIRDNQTPTAFNAQSMLLDLRYTPLDLRGIFETKLRELQNSFPAAFHSASDHDAIRAFLGTDSILHPTVVDSDGRPYKEDVFEYLRRHTRGRPRELDFLGHALQMVLPSERTPNRIRELVRDLSFEFFKFAKNEAVPFWDPMLDILLQRIPTNFVQRSTAMALSETEADTQHSRALWNALFANGLCGAVLNMHPGGMIQRFANHDRLAELSEEDFKSAAVWVLHPCVNIATWARRERYQANKYNVAGHAYSYVPAPKATRQHVHVLIGAGRLGLGLVTPFLLASKRTKVVVVARASDLWRPLLSGNNNGTVNLDVRYLGNGGEVHKVRVVSDVAADWVLEFRKAIQQRRCILLIASKQESIQYAAEFGDSIGTAVGPEGIANVADILAVANSKSKCIVAFENDQEAVERAFQILNPNKFALIPTVVDRICSGREVSSDAIRVTAEPYGRITAFAPNKLMKTLPPAFVDDAISGISVVSDRSAFEYIKVQKKWLVNAIHAAAAALVEVALRDVGAKPETANENLLGLIAYNMDIQSQLIGIKELMIVATLGTLDGKTLRGPALQERISELSEYADQSLKRILNGLDSPARVLQLNSKSLATKYRRLFENLSRHVDAAMRIDDIRAALPITDAEMKARLGGVSGAFARLFTAAAHQ